MSGCLPVLRDAAARLLRAFDALADGDQYLAAEVLRDLVDDLLAAVERLEDEGRRP